MSKYEEKTRISRGVNEKSEKFQGVIIKFTGNNPGGSTSKI